MGGRPSRPEAISFNVRFDLPLLSDAVAPTSSRGTMAQWLSLCQAEG
jgi:hypothetical protein